KSVIWVAVAIFAVAVSTAVVYYNPFTNANNTNSQNNPQGTEYTNTGNRFSVLIPHGWYAHEVEGGAVIFTKSKEFTLPEGTEGYAIGPQFVIRKASMNEIIGAKTFQDWLKGNGMTDESEFFVETKNVTNFYGHYFTGAITEAAQAEGNNLTYAHKFDEKNYLVISHYPYSPGSADSDAFEQFINSLRPIK
ncbi:MAG TPA: hypothetical protein VEC17_01605, partial [Candidatus Binatia bacterium]|nr:hypothetical protein [Candidatus Binatia bacterium]